MCLNKLSRIEALDLITPVIDDEVTSQERRLFFNSLKQYPRVRQQFHSASSIKKLIQTRCPKARAPLLFCERIRALIDDANLPGHAGN